MGKLDSRDSNHLSYESRRTDFVATSLIPVLEDLERDIRGFHFELKADGLVEMYVPDPTPDDWYEADQLIRRITSDASGAILAHEREQSDRIDEPIRSGIIDEAERARAQAELTSKSGEFLKQIQESREGGLRAAREGWR